MEEDARLWGLIALKLSKEASEEELKELEELLKNKTDVQNQLQILFNWWNLNEGDKGDKTAASLARALQRIQK